MGLGFFFQNWLELGEQTEKLPDNLGLCSGTPGANVAYTSVCIYPYAHKPQMMRALNIVTPTLSCAH